MGKSKKDERTPPRRAAKGILTALLAAAGTAAGAVAFGVMDYLYDPEFFRSGVKPSPSRETAPGEIDVSPAMVPAGAGRSTVEVRFRCGPGGISEDGGIKIGLCRMVDYGEKGRRPTFAFAHGWGPLQNRHPRLPNYYTCELRAAGGARIEAVSQGYFPLRGALRMLGREFLRRCGVRQEPLDVTYLLMEQRKIRLRVRGGRLQEGDEISITLGDTRGGSRGWSSPEHAGRVELAVEVDERTTGRYRLISDTPRLEKVGGEAARLETVLTGLQAEDGLLVLRAVDGRGEPDPTFTGSGELSPSGGLEMKTGVVFGEEDRGLVHVPFRVREGGVHRVVASAGGITGTSNPLPIEDGGPFLYWGDIHAHTVLCDGMLDPREFYLKARDEQGLNFAAITMHDTMERLEPSGREEEWELIRELREGFNQPGRFVTFLGYEWSSHPEGHRGVFFAPDEREARIHAFTDPATATAPQLEEALSDYEVMVIPHHTAWRRVFVLPWNWGKFMRMKIPERYNWWGPESEKQRLVEIYSDHGSSESYSGPFPITHGAPPAWFPRSWRDDRCLPGLGNYVQEALAGGLRLGIVAGSDRHDYPVDERVHPLSVYPGGLTGVWADELTDEALWRSLWNRRVYGTSGARIVLELFIDGLPMGTEYLGGSDPLLSGRVIGTVPLRKVELLRHDMRGYGTAWYHLGGEEVSFEFVDEGVQGEAFYYLRVEQEDGHWAWSSPVWLLR